ncbi:hypothetical protein FB45DRAFT_1054409 [Roridomyces roridus]|uniref:Uncharacterized protein n=1 Tax=Roridomyces roridus TaxID=1738132 RepID=A0AAD7FTH1_9AGAR|nr:hypothetical protein FB45DRAFT_1036475 [Roridomyces roridus]KAJ7624779.1 hypothetical protein FB45DRAFT_1060959 [Roridomyces roridus]KAJ7642076.1 hypothetical protein FB45DRAFT_1054409 [Roridomyces roridus]
MELKQSLKNVESALDALKTSTFSLAKSGVTSAGIQTHHNVESGDTRRSEAGGDISVAGTLCTYCIHLQVIHGRATIPLDDRPTA